MKVKVLPFNYIGHIVEYGQMFHTIRLAEWSPHYRTYCLRRDGGMIYAQSNATTGGDGKPDNDRDYFPGCYRLESEKVRASLR